MDKYLPFALPDIGEEEIAEVVDTIRSNWLTTGPKTKRFEDDFAKRIGMPYSLAVNSATAGLHLTLEAAGIKAGEYVITTPFTFPATAEVIRYFGAHPLFVDIDTSSFNIDPLGIERVLYHAKKEGKNVRGIIPVHFAGQACDMDPIMELSKEHNLFVIEDAAHALPTTYKGKYIGTIGDATVFSFYATKTITTGEGGMVVTAREDWAARIKIMRLHGINRDVWDRYTSNSMGWQYDVVEPGYKYNLTDIAASMGIHQLAKIDQFQERRQMMADNYSKAFKNLPIITPRNLSPRDKHAWHLYVIQIQENSSLDRDAFVKKMAELGIGTSVHFIPLHLHSYYRNYYGHSPDAFPNALKVFNRCVSLPIYTKMSPQDQERVISTVTSLLSGP